MNILIHRANTRGGADHGWLKTKHSFSFADWYDPNRMGFGTLRVLNDDVIAPARGFGEHSHDNFEIITIVMKGVVSHKDSLGNIKEVSAGEVQVMSAGTGVTHAEFNASVADPLELFQIWIESNVRNVSPRYDQKPFRPEERKVDWQIVVSSGDVPNSLSIYQDARIALRDLENREAVTYSISKSGNGVYLLVIEGEVEVEGEILGRRDAIGIWETKTISIKAGVKSSLLLIEVPVEE